VLSHHTALLYYFCSIVPENIIYLRLGGFETSFRLLKIDLSDGQLASSLYTRRLLSICTCFIAYKIIASYSLLNTKKNVSAVVP